MARHTRTWPELPRPLDGTVMDNHTHLPIVPAQIPKANGFAMPLDEQISAARATGIARQVTSACELPDFAAMIELASTYEGVRVALALHPNEAALHDGCVEPSPDGLTPQQSTHHIPLDDALAALEKALDNPMVVAVGESGLDYFRTAEAGRDAQKRSFAAHIDLAQHKGLPLQIHDREAHTDCLEVLDRAGNIDIPVVFHCFSGDAHFAHELAERGFYASFAGPITYPANAHLREALVAMPRELVLVETDAPYLTPVPHRGSPNASYVMAHSVRHIGELWDLPEDLTCAQLMSNSTRVYGEW